MAQWKQFYDYINELPPPMGSLRNNWFRYMIEVWRYACYK